MFYEDNYDKDEVDDDNDDDMRLTSLGVMTMMKL